jgi:type I restriction enzyme M protein
MPLKKSELYSSLWSSCDELRGGMDASQYKDYVLVLLFVKYVSDKAASQKGFLLNVPKGGRFEDMVALKGDKEIGDKINKSIARLAEANKLQGVIDVADWNDTDKLGKGQEMIDRLSNLVGIFQNLDFAGNRAEGDDLLGDAYEFLMRHFATESGKSKGQFYTPAEVSRIMAKVIGVGSANRADQTIYDPTCGSGSLLLKAHDEAKHTAGLDLALYGQDKDNTTSALARMNTILHNCPTAEIAPGGNSTLATPFFTTKDGGLKTFDFVVANPPFSTKAWESGFTPAEDRFRRFVFGIPPKKNGDYAFLLHVLTSLKSTGKGAIILPHGVLFRGNAEAGIRREIVRRGYIKGIIGLPPNLFYGTGIPACIVVIDKENAAARKGLFMIDASKGFIKDGNKNRLREQDIHKIVDTFLKLIETPRYSRMVSLAEIGDPKNDFNLNLPRYIDSAEPEDLHDISAHLRGGIPEGDIDALERYWQVIPGVRSALFKKGDRSGYAALKITVPDIKSTIFGHSEFTTYNDSVIKLFTKWKKANTPLLKGIGTDDKPKALIETLSEGLLEVFDQARLIDPYDIYQRLMDYWAETMQDDVYMIVGDGWLNAAKPRLIIPDKKIKVQPDFTKGKLKYKAELIPPSLIIGRYFADDQRAIETLEADAAEIERRMEEMAEEQSGEEGLLEEAKNEKGKITKVLVAARLHDIKRDPDAAEERKALNDYLDLIENEADIQAKIKNAQNSLTAKVAERYEHLTIDEIKTLVAEDKWLAALAATVQGELDRVSQTLTGRVRQLAERYDMPLPDVITEVETFATKVEGHLQRMGFQP